MAVGCCYAGLCPIFRGLNLRLVWSLSKARAWKCITIYQTCEHCLEILRPVWDRFALPSRIRIGLLTWGLTHPLYFVGASLDS